MSYHTKVRQLLKFHFSLIAQWKQSYSGDLRKERVSAQILAKLFGSGTILKKYRTIDAAKKEFGLSGDPSDNCQTRDVSTLKPKPIFHKKEH